MLLRLAKNFVSLLVFNFVDKIAFAVLFIVIARSVHTSEFGIYNLAITLIFIGGMLVNFGIENVLIREIAKDRSKTSLLYHNALLLTVSLAVLTWPLLIGLSSLLRLDPDVTSLLKIGGLIFFFTGTGQAASAVIKGYERIGLFALIAGCQSVLNLALGIIVLRSGGGLKGLIGIMVVTEAFKAVGLTLAARKLFSSNGIHIDLGILRQILKLAVPFALIMVYALVLDRVNILLMGMLKSLNDVAVYGVVSKFADFLSLFSASMVGSLYPALSSRLKADRDETWRLYNRSLGAFSLFGFGIAVFVIILASPIIAFLFGQQYVVGSPALRWMGMVFLLTMLSGPVGLLLLASGDQMYRLVAACIVVLFSNILLSLWLIPIYSYTGAAIASLISLTIGFAARMILSKVYFGKFPQYPSLIWRSAISSCAMGIILILMKGQHVIILLIIGGLVYCAMLFLLGEFKQIQYAAVMDRIRSVIGFRT